MGHSDSADDLQVVVDQPEEQEQQGKQGVEQPSKQGKPSGFSHPKTWSKNAKLGAGLGLLSLLALPLIIAPAVIVPKQKAAKAAAQQASQQPSSLQAGQAAVGPDGQRAGIAMPVGNNSGVAIKQITPATFDVAREPVSPFVRINGGQVRVGAHNCGAVAIAQAPRRAAFDALLRGCLNAARLTRRSWLVCVVCVWCRVAQMRHAGDQKTNNRQPSDTAFLRRRGGRFELP